MMNLFLKSKSNFFNKPAYILQDILFIILIICVVFFFVDFGFGKYLLSGDFRLSVHNGSVFGTQFLSLISDKFSNNNFVFLPFYPVYFFLKNMPYQWTLIYIYFGIPLLSFFCMRYVLLRASKFSNESGPGHYLFASSLAFYYALNPSIFERFGHWTILHGMAIFPIYCYFFYKFLKESNIFNQYLLIFPVVLYLGAMTPQLIVVYFFASVLICVTALFIGYRKIKIFAYASKCFVAFILALLSFFHIIYPILAGYGRVKSRLESPTTADILYYLSKNSEVYSAISGTNYYAHQINFLFSLSLGFLLFLIGLFFLFFKKSTFYEGSKDKILNYFILLYLLVILLIISGYQSFPWFYEILIASFFSDFMWVIKDPNMYYSLFAFALVVFLVRIIPYNKNKIIPFSLFIVTAHVVFLMSSDREFYNKFYSFLDIPEEYFDLSEEFSSDSGRNFWIPSGIYVKEGYAESTPYFPSPSLWLTKNKELTPSTKEYEDLIAVVHDQIFLKKCENIYFLDWVISAHHLNVFLDKNSTEDRSIKSISKGEDISEWKNDVFFAESCFKKLPNTSLIKSFGSIDVYKSSVKIQEQVYFYSGTIDGLNKFLEHYPVHVIYTESTQESYRKLDIKDYSILRESYDKNWLTNNGESAFDIVDLGSMIFHGKHKDFHYRQEDFFQKVVFWQKVILLMLTGLFLYLNKYGKRKK